jgi:transcriptional regulator with XRE-family HTH domain
MNDNSYNDWTAMSDDQVILRIGEFVKHHRMQQNITQEKLAKDAGISRSTLSLLEKGETVTVATLIQILRVLDQLHALDGFTITRQQSPLLLAQAEKRKRKRVSSIPKGKTPINKEEDIDW